LSVIKQYKDSLKTIEAEEILDLLIYRPVAFFLVKITYSLNITPNQVSATAMLVGIAAGIMFGFGASEYLTIGAILYFLCNVFDCADGQIARLKNNGTKVGRAIDGFIDYVVSIAVFIGIAVGMVHEFNHHSLLLYGNGVLRINPVVYIWIIMALAALSSAAQAFCFDFYRNKFLEIVYGKFSPLEDQVKEFTEEKRRLEDNPETAGIMDNVLVSLYLTYTKLQLKLQGDSLQNADIKKPNPKVYFLQNKMLLRLWSFLGSTTHITICIVCALANNMELFFLICILPLNFLFLLLYFTQVRVNKSLNKLGFNN
jgi:phosphatidylglycerophosphate synthase